jgi:hypothetical protein
MYGSGLSIYVCIKNLCPVACGCDPSHSTLYHHAGQQEPWAGRTHARTDGRHARSVPGVCGLCPVRMAGGRAGDGGSISGWWIHHPYPWAVPRDGNGS